jgi:hypothetical protein
MFGSNALPLPTNFASEHRPLRLTTEVPRPQPTGPCHSILLHPSVQNQRCSCQSFHHNRSAPGNICDCGHQSCYHVTAASALEPPRPPGTTYPNSDHNLIDKIKQLEKTIQHEREIREGIIQRERHAWEREVRILREALAPFYKSEQDMRRRLIEIEDRVEGNYDEQLRLRDRVVAIDDASMTVERRIEDLEITRGKRRRISRQLGAEEGMTNGQFGHDVRRVSSNIDEKSVHSSSSRALSPNSNFPTTSEIDEPRSSGILNLMDMPRSTPHAAPPARPPPSEEPRSSGFLALDLAERLGNRKAVAPPAAHPDPPYIHPAGSGTLNPPPAYARSNPDASFERRSPIIPRPVQNGLISNGIRLAGPQDLSPRKRKHFVSNHMALDVLADVSANPLFH